MASPMGKDMGKDEVTPVESQLVSSNQDSAEKGVFEHVDLNKNISGK